MRIEVGRRKGKIVVEFGSPDDLERIVTVLERGISSHPDET